MAEMRGGGSSLVLPGVNQGDVPTWDTAIGKYKPGSAAPPGTTPVPGDTLIFNPTTGTFMPWSQFPEPVGVRVRYDVRDSFGATADGTLLTTFPDTSGNAQDVSNGGGAQRPVFLTNGQGDGVPAVRFDGVAQFFRKIGFTAAPNVKDLCVFLVGHSGFVGGVEPWALGRAGVVDNAVGCTQGITSAIDTGALGCLAGNNLGGNTMRSAAFSSIDGGALQSSSSPFMRRVHAYRWGSRFNSATGLVRWGVTCYLAGQSAFFALDVDPPTNLWTFTSIVLGGGNNGGGAVNNFCPLDLCHYKMYFGTPFITDQQVFFEMQRLRLLYQCF